MHFHLYEIFTRKKVIGLDDLLSDHYKQKSSVLEKSKRAKAKKSYSSDEDEDIGEANLSRCVEECQKEAYTFPRYFLVIIILLIAYCNHNVNCKL